MATSICSRRIETLDPPTHSELKGGKIFGTDLDALFLKELHKWPSLGHYVLDRLANDNADKLILVSSYIRPGALTTIL